MRQHVIDSNKTTVQTRADIAAEVELWARDAGEKVITAWDIPAPETIGGRDATLRIQLRKMPVVLRCGSQPTYALNLRACYLALEGMRLNEKRGIGETMREAYLQLNGPVAKRDPYEVLGISPGSPAELAESAWKILAKSAHPDTGGSDARMKELNEAIEAIRSAKRLAV